MKAFGDAVYFIALLSTRDRWHARAHSTKTTVSGRVQVLLQFQAHRSKLSIRKHFVQSVAAPGSAYGTRIYPRWTTAKRRTSPSRPRP
jgi:hypothetical protein